MITVAAVLMAMAPAQEPKSEPAVPPSFRVPLRKFKEDDGRLAARWKEFDVLRTAVARTDAEKMLQWNGLLAVSKAILADQVASAATYAGSEDLRREAFAEVEGVLRHHQEDLDSLMGENAPVLDALFSRTDLVDAILKADVDPAKAEAIIRREFEKDPQTAALLLDLRDRLGESLRRIGETGACLEAMKKIEELWKGYLAKVEAAAEHAQMVLADNERRLLRDLETYERTRGIETPVWGAPPGFRSLFGEGPPGTRLGGPQVPKFGASQDVDEAFKLDPSKVREALKTLYERHKKKAETVPAAKKPTTEVTK